MWLLDRILRRLIRKGELILVDHDGTQYSYGTLAPDIPPVTVRLTDKRAAFDIARDPRLGAGEAYMDGRMVVDRGDVRDLIMLIQSNAPFEGGGHELRPKGLIRRTAENAISKLDQMNSKRRASRNAAHTYNLTRELYELFLDEDRQYTCAYWTDLGNSLEQAQLDKKAHIASKLQLKPGLRILDIGCGWGGLALSLHRICGAEVLGVALAEDQIAVARERAEAAGVADKVKFELMDYRDLTGEFDRITNVGLVEHIGAGHYNDFFQQCRRLLAPDGVMLCHYIGRMGGPGITDRWTSKYIFPGGYVPALSEILSVSEQHRLIVSDIETLRLHYAYTLKHWYDRTNASREELVRLYDERFLRMWQFYLAGAEAAFRYGGLVNHQIQYIKERDALPITRDYMIQAEAELSEGFRASSHRR
jgi:cyclopropane-fatty-acyl-phospholipid synthase